MLIQVVKFTNPGSFDTTKVKVYSALNRGYLKNQIYLKNKKKRLLGIRRGYLRNTLWTQLHLHLFQRLLGPILLYNSTTFTTSTCFKHFQVLLFPSCYTRLLKQPNLLLNSTAFRAKDLHLFQTLLHIVIFFLWYEFT